MFLLARCVHRAGRTGRMGSKGFVFSLVGKRDAAVAAAVRASLSAGVSLEGLGQRPGEAARGGVAPRARQRFRQRSKAVTKDSFNCSPSCCR